MNTSADHTYRMQGEATLERVREMSQATGRVLREWGLPEDRVLAWEVAVAELGSNVCRHAYGPDGTGPIELELRWDEQGVWITVGDEGERFTPQGVPLPPEPDRDDPETWPEGGMGIMFVRSAGDDLLMRHDGSRNLLTLFTAIPAPRT